MSMDYVIEPALPEDAGALADLRVTAMRESLEAIGRFDPQRARDRLLASFTAGDTFKVFVAGELAGFYVCKRHPTHLHLDHLYFDPRFQGRGLGGAVIASLQAHAAALSVPLCVSALRASRSNAFYRRHGFEQTREEEWDIYYEHRPAR